MSSGWRIEVNPPGITARSVFSCLNDDFTLSVMWASNASKTSRLLLLPRPPIQARHTFLIQIFIWSESIHPFSWAETTTPCLLLIFGTVFRLKMTIGFSLEPSPQQANTTVTLFFSFPMVRIFTVFSPVWLIVRFGGISNVSGVSSMFTMRCSG